MNKPILENRDINLVNLYHFIWDILKKYSKYCFYILILFTVYFFIKTPSYSSKVSFYANYQETQQLPSSFSFISSLGGMESGDLGFSIPNYLDSEKFLQDIVEKKYNIEGKKTLIEHWGKDYNKIFSFNPINVFRKINRNLKIETHLTIEQKKTLFAKEVLRKNITHSEDRKSSLHTISFEVGKYPQLSKEVANAIFESILNYSNEVTHLKAGEKKDFIQSRLKDVKKDLENAENKMLVFIENNKNLNYSPNLMLQRDRIQRNISLYSQLYISLSDQLELTKIDEKDTTSSIFLLDAPYISSYKPGGDYLESLFILFVLFYGACTMFEFYRNRYSLFK